MRPSSAARFILGSILIVALVLPAAPALAETTAYDGHHYEIVPTTTGSWIDASNQAAASTYLESPGHLVTITSAEENAFVNGLVPAAGGSGYIGLHDQVNEGTFTWVTGELVSYTAWEPGEPNNFEGVEDCAIQYPHGSWNDTGCTYQAASHFVIEYDGPFADSTPPTNPQVESSHTSAWSVDSTIIATLSGAADDRGVAGYAVLWSTSSGSSPDPVITQPASDTSVASPRLDSGEHYLHIRTADGAGNWSDASSYGPYRIDRTSPTQVVVRGPRAFHRARRESVTARWSAASDTHAGVAGYKLQYSRMRFAPNTEATGYTAENTVASTTERTASLPLQLGARNCMRVVATDGVDLNSMSRQRCINVPYAATQFRASAGDGWQELDRKRFAFGTAMTTDRQGARLRRTIAATRVGIRAIECRRCGVVRLRWGGHDRPFAQFRLRGTWTGVPAVKMAPAFAQRTSGTLIVEVASTNRRIAIDSIIVR